MLSTTDHLRKDSPHPQTEASTPGYVTNTPVQHLSTVTVAPQPEALIDGAQSVLIPSGESRLSRLNKGILRKWDKNTEITSSTLAFCLLFWLYWVVIFVHKMLLLATTKANNGSFHSWIDCVFVAYDGKDDMSWIPLCGPQPSPYDNRNMINMHYTYIACACGQSIALCIVFCREFPVLFPWHWMCGSNDEAETDREVVRILQIRQSEENRRKAAAASVVVEQSSRPSWD
jgi:hypothetical protein